MHFLQYLNLAAFAWQRSDNPDSDASDEALLSNIFRNISLATPPKIFDLRNERERRRIQLHFTRAHDKGPSKKIPNSEAALLPI